jgi:hypothetical protein
MSLPPTPLSTSQGAFGRKRGRLAGTPQRVGTTSYVQRADHLSRPEPAPVVGYCLTLVSPSYWVLFEAGLPSVLMGLLPLFLSRQHCRPMYLSHCLLLLGHIVQGTGGEAHSKCQSTWLFGSIFTYGRKIKITWIL